MPRFSTRIKTYAGNMPLCTMLTKYADSRGIPKPTHRCIAAKRYGPLYENILPSFLKKSIHHINITQIFRYSKQSIFQPYNTSRLIEYQ